MKHAIDDRDCIFYPEMSTIIGPAFTGIVGNRQQVRLELLHCWQLTRT